MTTKELSRRAFLAGLSTTAAGSALALETGSVVRPRLRTGPVSTQNVASVQALIDAAKLNGSVAYAVADARTGELLETRSHLRAMPPASVTKALTAHYALTHLGPGYRYRTRLLANGTVSAGQLRGDLILVASGDPVLSTDDLGAMTEALKAAGIREVTGRFMVTTPSFAETRNIDDSQPYQVSYNPGVAGLNLNLNRVHFEWTRNGSEYDITMEARSARYRPACTTSTMEIVDRPGPVYDFKRIGGVDRWSVARDALGKKGARWLPVQSPVDYALDAFSAVLEAGGVSVAKPERVAAAPHGITIFEAVSPEMRDILRYMLKVSTNLTAEVVGQTATIAAGKNPTSIRDSARQMSTWLRRQSDARRPKFVDHSGLGEANDITPHDMVTALVHAGPDGALAGLLKPWSYRPTGDGSALAAANQVVAKTGTLNFVSGLAGFIKPVAGRPLAFAIFAADEERRKTLTREERERPVGGKSWGRRARTLDDELVKRWTSLYT